MWRRILQRAAARPSSYHPRWRFSTAPPRRFAALWGNGDHGRLGLGSLESRWRPTICPFSPDDLPVSVACGGAHTLFLTESGRVYASGLNNFGQLGITTGKSYSLEPVVVCGLPDNIVQVSAGYYHSSAVTDDGELYVWGKNSSGQLGLGKRSESIVSTPTRVDCLIGIHVKMVALGSEHSIAITDEGNTLSWGAGGFGRLGHGHRSSILGFLSTSSEYTPRLIKFFEDIKVKRIAAGMLHSACIDEKGTVFVFGERTTGKLGFGESKNMSTPIVVPELPFCEDVACGGYHTCVVTDKGELYSWGSNENGCLGLGCTEIVRKPQIVESLQLKFPVSVISCGWKHTAAVSGRKVFSWGWGGSNGTFFEDGHSSGGQLAFIYIFDCYSIIDWRKKKEEKRGRGAHARRERSNLMGRSLRNPNPDRSKFELFITHKEGHGNDVDYIEPMVLNLGENVGALHVSCGFNHTGGIFEYKEM